MQLKGSKTHGNLKAAFAGESQANRRYLYFAAKADVEGQNDVAAVFRSTAEGETGHAHGHLEYLEQCGDPATDLPFGNSRANLKAAIAGETHEYTDMYPGMAKAARQEGFSEIADWFRPSPRRSARTPTASRRRSTGSPTRRTRRCSSDLRAGRSRRAANRLAQPP
jgi:rubrerythrin